MKWVRYGKRGEEKPGVLDPQGNIHDLSRYIADFNPQQLSNLKLIEQLRTLKVEQLPLVKSDRLGACISQPGKLLCVGYNCSLHTAQMGMKPMAKDILVFLKPASAICGPNDPILYGRHMKKLDWEAELGIVIGKKGKYIPKEQAKEHILGYVCINDLSERYLQLETSDSQYTKGKGFDSAAPIGPYLVTKDEIPNAHDLQVSLWVNGVLRQHFNTGDYTHHDDAVVSYLSQYFTLYPGDIISMGSGPGNAKFWGENMFLKPDDKVTFTIAGLGQQEQIVVVE